ncbi:MAG: hypothetical protein H6Q49_698 [Deltaproteobacteria bacterium]|nr:hypothetical protein [Deltaproteobacteria bacterium]
MLIYFLIILLLYGNQNTRTGCVMNHQKVAVYNQQRNGTVAGSDGCRG